MACPVSNTRFLVFVIFTLLALGLGIGFNLWHSAKTQRVIPPIAGTNIDRPQLLPEFHLIDGHDKPFTNHNLKNHFSLLFFGFTHCQGICPLTLSMLTQLYKELKAEKLLLPQVIFITLDPRRDTPKVIGSYVKAFNPNFIGVSGPSMGIQQLSKQMGVVYIQTQQSKTSENNYQLDHSGTLYLINPEGKLSAIFSPPHDEASIKQDYKNLVSR
ncbi:MAG: SCO family protein [Candidatus Aquirickettsiella sp.]